MKIYIYIIFYFYILCGCDEISSVVNVPMEVDTVERLSTRNSLASLSVIRTDKPNVIDIFWELPSGGIAQSLTLQERPASDNLNSNYINISLSHPRVVLSEPGSYVITLTYRDNGSSFADFKTLTTFYSYDKEGNSQIGPHPLSCQHDYSLFSKESFIEIENETVTFSIAYSGVYTMILTSPQISSFKVLKYLVNPSAPYRTYVEFNLPYVGTYELKIYATDVGDLHSSQCSNYLYYNFSNMRTREPIWFNEKNID